MELALRKTPFGIWNTCWKWNYREYTLIALIFYDQCSPVAGTHTHLADLYKWSPFIELAKPNWYRHVMHEGFDIEIHGPDLKLLRQRSNHLFAVKLWNLQQINVSLPAHCISFYLCTLFQTNPLRLAAKCDNAPFSKQK